MKGDIQLKEHVVEELAWDPSVDSAELGVQVKDGVVTLTGHLSSHAAKYAAEEAVRRVPGVKGLAVEINVRLPNDAQRTDADIARAASNILAWTSVLPADRIQVMVENGSVTLTGSVDWHYQRLAAERVVAGLYGVVSVANAIVVQPAIIPADIKELIARAIERQAADDASHVAVDVKDGVVTLSGSVRTWAERDAAFEAAWAAPGVRNVSNIIQVNL
ncbi:Osmotically-inducible protein OsmY, contains BON domain [Cupriavidus sp. YR651]|uniref:BON domain-containing protein n=1 Tax=Cupriavidus sp. YR651 TaxID=1855315 RepID=UPI00088FF1D8|nr:BON domain-containing protein [Cupriavidus sp. YR651]SDD85090.1 Osmotically-inducible protein OsmY, contains BON domain [Cupriavidus sp. YR651]